MHLLVAEDDATTQKILRIVLERSGHIVCLVEDGERLEACLAVHPTGYFDAIVTDNDMPIKTGLDVLKDLRKMESFKNIPIIVYTSTEDICSQVIALGGIHVTKTPPLHRALVEVLELIERGGIAA